LFIYLMEVCCYLCYMPSIVGLRLIFNPFQSTNEESCEGWELTEAP